MEVVRVKKIFTIILHLALGLGIMGCGEQATTREDNTAQTVTEESQLDAAQESISGGNNEQKDEQQENVVSEFRSEAPATPTEAPKETVEIPFSTDFYDYESMTDL